MISVCVCSLNARWDTEIFVRALQAHNNSSDFEVCIAHDNRVEDGSTEAFKKLQEEFGNVKVITNTHKDIVEWLWKLDEHYENRNLFGSQFRKDMRKHIELFEKKELFDHNRAFLWASSGMLYNKAVSISSGDNIIITPGDFIYMFSLRDLDNFMNQHNQGGRFYSSPNASWARTSNFDEDWLREHTNTIHTGKWHREGFRWDTNEVARDFFRCPTTLEENFICDFYNNKLIRFSDSTFVNDCKQFLDSYEQKGGMQYLPGFHGFHAMTRKTYHDIGGFTEEWIGRAFADDKMTSLGNRQPGARSLPTRFSVAWCGQYELVPYTGPCYPENWKEILLEKNPRMTTMHLSTHMKPRYIHEHLVTHEQMDNMIKKFLNRAGPPVRLVT
jgi:hypothetical protein